MQKLDGALWVQPWQPGAFDRLGWYSRDIIRCRTTVVRLITTMFLINKPKLIPLGAFEAWLWRRWHALID
jgi:hypothetical protein